MKNQISKNEQNRSINVSEKQIQSQIAELWRNIEKKAQSQKIEERDIKKSIYESRLSAKKHFYLK